jgi:hypothetical protein
VEFRIRRSDGVYRWFKTRAIPLRDSTGRVVKWFGSNTDFQDYREAAAKLESQLERLSLLDRITRAIAERHDLDSIFQVVIRSLRVRLRRTAAAGDVFEGASEPAGCSTPGSPISRDNRSPR